MRLGHCRHRDHSVFFNEARDVVPPPAVLRHPLVHKQPFTVEPVGIAKLDDALQVEIGFLHLVPKLQIGVGEFEVLHLVPQADLGPHRVKAGEHPAAPGRLLVGDALGFNAMTEKPVLARHNRAIESEGINAVVGDRVVSGLVTRAHFIPLSQALQEVRSQSSLGRILAKRRSKCERTER